MNFKKTLTLKICFLQNQKFSVKKMLNTYKRQFDMSYRL